MKLTNILINGIVSTLLAGFGLGCSNGHYLTVDDFANKPKIKHYIPNEKALEKAYDIEHPFKFENVPSRYDNYWAYKAITKIWNHGDTTGNLWLSDFNGDGKVGGN
jgi:hypothetical protein